MPREDSDGVFVILPLFARPLRASLTIDREIRSEQLRALSGMLQKHLHELVPIVDSLKHSGWEVLGGETSLICRHPSVRTKAQAEVALSLLGVDFGWYSVCDPVEFEQHPPRFAENEDPPEEP
jgi:hypothetical protein